MKGGPRADRAAVPDDGAVVAKRAIHEQFLCEQPRDSNGGPHCLRFARVARPPAVRLERGAAAIQVETAPELGQQQRPKPVDALSPVRLAGRALAQRRDVARLEQPARRHGGGSEQVVGHRIEHVAELEIVLQAVEALADGERPLRQQARAGFAQNVLLRGAADLEPIRYREGRRNERRIRVLRVHAHADGAVQVLDRDLVRVQQRIAPQETT